MKISVYLDLRYTTRPQQTGVDRHVREVVDRISRYPHTETRILASQEQLNEGRVSDESSVAGHPANEIPMHSKLCRYGWPIFGWPPADRWCNGTDWIYSPQEMWAPAKTAKTAVTIHGSTFFERHHPKYFSPLFILERVRLGCFFRFVCKNADLVLPVSTYLERFLIERFGLDQAKSCVIGNGISSIFFDAGDAAFKSKSSYNKNQLLVVAGLNDWDGAKHILSAAEALFRVLPSVKIKLAGTMDEAKYLCRAAALPNVELLGYLPSDVLAQEMVSSLALLYLPNVESFGMVALEAMAVGLPVIACRLTAVPETCGNAACYVDVANPDSIIEVVLQLQQDEIRKAWVEKGKVHAQSFTWDAVASRIMEAFAMRGNKGLN